MLIDLLIALDRESQDIDEQTIYELEAIREFFGGK